MIVVNRVISSLKKVLYLMRRVFCSTILELKILTYFLLIISEWVFTSSVEAHSGFVLGWSIERIKLWKSSTILRIVNLIMMDCWRLEINCFVKPRLRIFAEDIWSIYLSDLASWPSKNLLIRLHSWYKFWILFNFCE